jgi:hypothetical protein
VRIWMHAQPMTYFSFFGPVLMCATACYQLFFKGRLQHDTA